MQKHKDDSMHVSVLLADFSAIKAWAFGRTNCAANRKEKLFKWVPSHILAVPNVIDNESKATVRKNSIAYMAPTDRKWLSWT